MLRCHTCMIRKWVVAADVMETALDVACMIKNAVLENRLPVRDKPDAWDKPDVCIYQICWSFVPSSSKVGTTNLIKAALLKTHFV